MSKDDCDNLSVLDLDEELLMREFFGGEVYDSRAFYSEKDCYRYMRDNPRDVGSYIDCIEEEVE